MASSAFEIPFSPYNDRGVRVSIHPATYLPRFWDDTEANVIGGHTCLDRYPVLHRRIADVCAHLRETENSPVKVLFAPCSVGYEPLSFARILHERQQLRPDFVQIFGLDKNPRFIDCAKAHKIPHTLLAHVPRGIAHSQNKWKQHLEPENSSGGFRFRPTLTDHITFLEAQDFRNHHEAYDIVTMMNLLYYFKADSRDTARAKIGEDLLMNAFESASAAVVVDHNSNVFYREELQSAADAKEFTCLSDLFHDISHNQKIQMEDALNTIFLRDDLAHDLARTIQENTLNDLRL